jgi:hypothetical protein
MSTNAENPTDGTGDGTDNGNGNGNGESTGTAEGTNEATAATERLESSLSPEPDQATRDSALPEPTVPTTPAPPTPEYFRAATDPLPPAPAYFSAPTAPVSVAPSRPHVRWGGVVWGAILVAIAGFVLFTVSSHARQSAFNSWVAGLTPGAGWTLAVVAVGVFILILALLAVVRSAQRNRRA